MNFLELLSNLFAGLFGSSHLPADTSTKVPTVDTKASAPPGWEGAPPYRYLDVSVWQGKIKMEGWQAIKGAGYKGVMLRACGNSADCKPSKAYIDKTFENNYANAKAAGLEIGVYYYTKATSEPEADNELAVLRQALRGKELTMPVAVDMENPMLTVHKPKDLTNLAAYHLEQIEKMGFYAQFYTYTSYANRYLEMERLAGRWDVWLADYTGKTPKVDFHYGAHQHTSKGSVPGIKGPVDLDVTTVNYPRIIRKKGLTRLREGA